MPPLPFGPARTRALAPLLFLLVLFPGWSRRAEAQEPLFAFAQISDSQPETLEHLALFQQVLDTIVAAGSPGALIPLPIDFVLFPGDLVSNGETPTNSAYYSSREGANPPELVVEAAPVAAPLADFAGAPTEGGTPLPVAFTDLSANGPTSWLWDFGDGATATEQSPSHTYAEPGVYDVALVVTNAGGSSTHVRSGCVSVAQGVSTLTLAPTADAKVGSAKPTRNYGAAPDLGVKSGAWRSFLRFEAHGLGRPVLRATLRLFVGEGSSNGGALYVVSDAWSEESITWNTAPPLLGAPIASLGPVAIGTWVEVDVTTAIGADGSTAFGLESPSTNLAYFESREGANAPHLVIEMAE